MPAARLQRRAAKHGPGGRSPSTGCLDHQGGQALFQHSKPAASQHAKRPAAPAACTASAPGAQPTDERPPCPALNALFLIASWL